MSEITNVEAVQEENFAELLEQSIKTLNTGDKVVGTVTGIGNTEVQVDLGTKHAGYIPYDEVSTDPSVKPEDILKVGDEIEVFVVRVNDQEGTVQLSKKKLDGLKVWDDIAQWVEDKTTVEGTITEENKGGLVANVKGIRVFIPASQSGIAKGGDMTGMVGKTVQMKITEVNRARRRFFNGNSITKRNGLHNHLHIMVSVRPGTQNIQCQIHFCRCPSCSHSGVSLKTVPVEASTGTV